ncbi:hypothetical protein N7457_000736 [Penicillium paradoxum]|uniref:uncharacterized protein n=1 Tax=Penicillium paradoxum TaxID=176176 RepID=UPI00254861BD|nr:uncharacterized protein N7457_000736 [Penicillium paradoxum]KAJ5794137.1 hypothetical protein N7457_000736 [Penicillium paradoxum]
MSLDPIEKCMNGTCYGLYQGKSVPTSAARYTSLEPTMAAIAVDNETPTHLASRDAIDAPVVGGPKSTSEDNIVQERNRNDNIPEETGSKQDDKHQENDYVQGKDQAHDGEMVHDYMENESDAGTESLAPLEPACLGGVSLVATNIKIVRGDIVVDTVGGDTGVLRRKDTIASVWNI